MITLTWRFYSIINDVLGRIEAGIVICIFLIVVVIPNFFISFFFFFTQQTQTHNSLPEPHWWEEASC